MQTVTNQKDWLEVTLRILPRTRSEIQRILPLKFRQNLTLFCSSEQNLNKGDKKSVLYLLILP